MLKKISPEIKNIKIKNSKDFSTFAGKQLVVEEKDNDGTKPEKRKAASDTEIEINFEFKEDTNKDNKFFRNPKLLDSIEVKTIIVTDKETDDKLQKALRNQEDTIDDILMKDDFINENVSITTDKLSSLIPKTKEQKNLVTAKDDKYIIPAKKVVSIQKSETDFLNVYTVTKQKPIIPEIDEKINKKLVNNEANGKKKPIVSNKKEHIKKINLIKDGAISSNKVVDYRALEKKDIYFSIRGEKKPIFENIIQSNKNKLISNTDYITELLFTQTEDNFYIVFGIDFKKLFENKSLYIDLFGNQYFSEFFFSNYGIDLSIKVSREQSYDYKPTRISKKIDKEVIYEKSISVLEENLTSIGLKKINNFWFFIVEDSTIKDSLSSYIYHLDIELVDKTTDFLLDVANLLQEDLDILNEIQANISNYYNFILNKFNESFCSSSYATQINKIFNDLANIAELLGIENIELQDLIAMKDANNFNIEIFSNISNILSTIKNNVENKFNKTRENSAIKRRVKTSKNNNINLSHSFKNIVYNKKYPFIRVDMFNKGNGFAILSRQSFLDRINTEVNRYFATNNITIGNKLQWLSGKRFIVKDFILKQTTIDRINYEIYKTFIQKLLEELNDIPKSQNKINSLNQISSKQNTNIPLFSYTSKEGGKLVKKNNLTPILEKKQSSKELNSKSIEDLFFEFISINNFDSKNEFLFDINEEYNIVNELDEDIPLQIKSLIESFKKSGLSRKQYETGYGNKYYEFLANLFNYFTLYQIEYLSEQGWEIITESVFNSDERLLCRITQPIVNKLKLNQNNILKLNILNQVFIIE